MPLFEVAILEKPTKKQADEGLGERVVYGIQAVVADNRDSAIVEAMKGAKLDVTASRLQVLVRPFVNS